MFDLITASAWWEIFCRVQEGPLTVYLVTVRLVITTGSSALLMFSPAQVELHCPTRCRWQVIVVEANI
jgi:hypothetical protein